MSVCAYFMCVRYLHCELVTTLRYLRRLTVRVGGVLLITSFFSWIVEVDTCSIIRVFLAKVVY